MTRINIIRNAIIAEGGLPPMRCGSDYYCDGPHSGSAWALSANHRKRNETIYKVPKHVDGLTEEARKRVVEALRAHPDVKDAYLSRPYSWKTHVSGGTVFPSQTFTHTSEGHLKIVFDGTAYEYKRKKVGRGRIYP